MGDLNARHKELGSHLNTNVNGVHWKAHHRYSCAYWGTCTHTCRNMPTNTAKTFLVRPFLSDHFARAVCPGSAQEPLDDATIQDGGPRHPCGEALYNGLLHTIEGFITTPRVLAKAHAPRCWTYATDLVILNCQQTLAVYQRCWQLNPVDTESRDAMVTVAQHLMDLRQQERKKYWVSFLDKVRRTRSLKEVWHHVNSVRGKSR
ncbi:hypothetical protein E2C01_054143 [Portunus trituberculatus]|uniref:Uncharacterized protein n=1 Tax=Portunus trituberculatus TaxID=210409 RepID=A0A5B7GR58_PORTR|nr:hypothetical protein [Portunus trituberculatus]